LCRVGGRNNHIDNITNKTICKMKQPQIVKFEGIKFVSPHLIPAELAGFQTGMSAGFVGGRIFLDEIAVVCDNFRIPGGTVANFARLSAGKIGWNIDPEFVEPGDPVESLVDEQEKMIAGVIPQYSFAQKTAFKGPGKFTLVVNLMFTDAVAARALQDFKNLTNAPVNASVPFVEFSNEWFMNRYRGRILGRPIVNSGDADAERQILIDRAEAVREKIIDYCVETGIPIPRFIWPFASYDERGPQFDDHNRDIVQSMEPGDLIAVHDYFIGHGGGAVESLSDFQTLALAVADYNVDSFIRSFEKEYLKLPEGSAISVTEWSLKNRGAGWKGSIAETALSVRYFCHLMFSSYVAPGMIVSANFQNLFSDVNGPGIYTQSGGVYNIDGTGLLLSTLFQAVAGGGCRIVKLHCSVPTALENHVDNQLIHFVSFIDQSGNVTVVYHNLSGAEFVFNAASPGISIQISGNDVSDYIGPVYSQVGNRYKATLKTGRHDGEILIPGFSVGLLTIKQ
jgi:hypothetical protein